MAFKLEHVHVKTRDPQATARFYIEALGAELIEVKEAGRHFRLNLHGLTLNVTDHIQTQRRNQRYGLEHFAVQTDDLEGTVARLEAVGGRVLERFDSPVPAHEGGRVCFVEGPEGVQLELVEVKNLARGSNP